MTRSLFVLHGALGSADQMAPVGEALRIDEPSLVVHVLELPGHGRTPEREQADPSAFRMETFIQAIRDAVRDAAIGAAAPLIFGYSMGGYAALLLEASAPGTFGGVLTLGTMLDWNPMVSAAATGRLDPAVIRAKVPAFAAQLDARHEAVGGADSILARTAGLLTALGTDPPLTPDRLAAIRCPVTFLVGERDDSVAFPHTEAIAASMLHGTAHLLPGVPHPIEKVPSSVICEAVRALAARVVA